MLSDVDRVKDTAEEIIEASKAEDKFQIREKQPLKASSFITGDPESSEFIKKVDRRTSEAMKVPEENREEKLKKAESKNVREWLSYGDESPDAEVASPKEVAKGLAQRIKTYVEMSDRLKSDSEVELLNVTHEFMVAAFIKYFLKKEDGERSMDGEGVLETLGYRIDPLEGVSITITTDRKGQKGISTEINGEEYELDMEKIRNLS